MQNTPAWVVSFVLHLVAILLLGLWVLPSPDEAAFVTLSAAIGQEDLSGDPGQLDEPLDAFRFDQPDLPQPDLPENDLAANFTLGGQTTLQLQTTAPASLQPLASLAGVEDLLAPVVPVLRGGMFAGRDPRLRGQILRREGGTRLTEAAVARGLKWLARHQNADGSWSLHAFHKAPGADGTCGGAGGQSDTAGTALGLLPFLGAGQTHCDGDYQQAVRKGLRWLVEHQADNGDLRDHHGFGRMYAHGQAAIVLCEAYAMTGDQQLRLPAQKSLDFIVKAQHAQGGWRYHPNQAGDTSVVGWQLMALQSGRMYYLHVPRRTLRMAGYFLDRVKTDSIGGLYAYQPGRTASPAMTAEALLCRLYLGWPTNHPAIKAGVDYLLEHLPDQRSPNIYYWYYATQVMHHVGGEAWPKWNARIRTVLVDMQETKGHAAGSWAPRGGFAARGGRLYMTSLAICTLEVYYRHMPLNRAEAVAGFQRPAE